MLACLGCCYLCVLEIKVVSFIVHRCSKFIAFNLLWIQMSKKEAVLDILSFSLNSVVVGRYYVPHFEKMDY